MERNSMERNSMERNSMERNSMEINSMERNSMGEKLDGRETRWEETRWERNSMGEKLDGEKLDGRMLMIMSPSPGFSYLDRVVLEIIETERVYVRDLKMIVQDYLGHIIDQSELSFGPEQVCALFGNIEEIYEFNRPGSSPGSDTVLVPVQTRFRPGSSPGFCRSDLLLDLERCGQDPVEVARCFVLKSEDFEIYTTYCTNYPRYVALDRVWTSLDRSVQVLAQILRDQTWASFLRRRQQILKTPLPLGSYLLKPVQRVLKYHLLLQEIRTHWDQAEVGGDIVEAAVVSMTTVAWFINEMKRRHESSVRVQEVQSLLLNWKGPDLTTFGDLVLEGTFKLSRQKNQRNLFLFHKVLLLAKKKNENYVYKNHITTSSDSPRPAQTVPDQLRPSQASSDRPRPAQTVPGQLRPSQASSDCPRPAQTVPGQLRLSQTSSDCPRPAQTVPGQLRPSQDSPD
ncbi:hypothetical protein WMY93_015331 [Mugilogobius chulae]|uniref:DH domain-containing protein n=1 Tax=Mugilogobius chulae TaxID=88201 RepID=A0AAW0NZY8_9GOBI